MPIVTPDDVAAGFRARWNASHVPDSTLVPSGLHYGRAPAGTTGVYAVFTVEEGETEDFGGPYLQKFTVKVAVYAQSGSDGPKTGERRGEMENAFRWTEQMVVPKATRVICVKPVGGGLEYANQMREAQNMVIASGAWEVLIQSRR